MRQFTALLKKELLETVRDKRALMVAMMMAIMMKKIIPIQSPLMWMKRANTK